MNRPETIEETAALVDGAGGHGIAARVDHLVPDEVSALVDRISGEQGANMLVNDIWGPPGGVEQSVWESSLETDCAPCLAGTRMPSPATSRAPRQKPGLVVEVTDGTGGTGSLPGLFFTTCQAAKSNGVRAGAETVMAPWPYVNPLVEVENADAAAPENWRDATTRSPHFAISESPAFVGRAVAALAQDPNVSRWNGKSLSSGQLAKIYGFTDLDGSQPDAWRYVTEVQDAGKPADTTGYR
jgi:hypothetical protein